MSHAKDVARRMLDHGAGNEDDSLNRYWDDDERNLELAEYSPLHPAVHKNGGCRPRRGPRRSRGG